jgi:hypothetical protein
LSKVYRGENKIEMSHLNVEFFEKYSTGSAIAEVAVLLDGVSRNLINQTPWMQYCYCPAVHFAMGYGIDCIFLKYYVSEKSIQAANGTINGPVYQDSCVEFFVSLNDEKAYYNFEFNCIGTAHAGYGEKREGRELLKDDLISQVKYQSVINNQGNDIHWELTVIIPFTLFCYHKVDTLAGKNCKANFYKCGDHLPTPHFVSWTNINSEEPNFHLPEFFGSLKFK